MTNHNPTTGTLADFLEETGDREAVYGQAVKHVLAWQLEQARQAQGLTKEAFASALNTSRAQVNRVLDPENVAISLDTLQRAAHALGKRIRIELVDAS